MVTRAKPSGRLLLADVSWASYERLLRALDNRHLRITYDRGQLEVMVLSFDHETWSYLLGRLVDALTEELHLPVAGGKSTTFKHRRESRGLEPDNCYWIEHEGQIRNKSRIDLRVDPPPDLTLEIDVTHSSLDRLDIYFALGVPEVWRFDGREVTFYVLAEEAYRVSGHSRSFPAIGAEDLNRFLRLRGKVDANTIVSRFRTWIRTKRKPK